MRVSHTKNLTQLFIRQLWSILEMDLCEQVEWIDVDSWSNSTGVLDEFETSGQVDMIDELWIMSESRVRRFNFSFPFYRTVIELVLHTHRAVVHEGFFSEESAGGLVTMFLPSVWVSIIVIILLFLLVSAYLDAQTETMFNWASAWVWFEHYMNKSPRRRFIMSKTSASAILAVGGLYALHSLNLYQIVLLAHLVYQHPYEPPVHSVDDVAKLIDSGAAKFNLQRPYYFVADILYFEPTTDPEILHLREALRRNPPVFLNPVLPEEKLKLDSITENGQLVITASDETDKHSLIGLLSCESVFVPIGGWLPVALMFAPHVPQERIDCVNVAINKNWKAILSMIDHSTKSTQHQYELCRKDLYRMQSRQVGDPIRLIRLTGAFLVFFVGCCLAWTIFLVKHCMSRIYTVHYEKHWYDMDELLW